MAEKSEIKDLAPNGTIWWCPDCGRLSADRYGKLATKTGWTSSCSARAFLVVADTILVEADGRVREADLVSDQPPTIDGWNSNDAHC